MLIEQGPLWLTQSLFNHSCLLINSTFGIGKGYNYYPAGSFSVADFGLSVCSFCLFRRKEK
jgi:hypothetical protein